jgi:DNA-binding response OmpR family regulator
MFISRAVAGKTHRDGPSGPCAWNPDLPTLLTRNMRVLVVDDEPDVLLLCRVNLGFAGHEVLEASNGERGVELALGERPDVIVLDVMLPRRDGYSVLEELVSDRRTRETPVILLTANAQDADRRRGWRAGCTEYMTKPFSLSALAEAVDRVAEMTEDERQRYREQEVARWEA